MPKLSSAYYEYLNSDEWKEKRLEFLEDADYVCEECGGKANQVHHLSYDNFGDETDDDVEVLCYGCHKDKEEEKGNDMEENADGEY